jgi:nicotinate phosphoribosyltransferase
LNLETIDGELASFITFAVTMPHNFLVLADTYDTLSSGAPNFICVAFAL